jgi:hypothetical protein
MNEPMGDGKKENDSLRLRYNTHSTKVWDSTHKISALWLYLGISLKTTSFSTLHAYSLSVVSRRYFKSGKKKWLSYITEDNLTPINNFWKVLSAMVEYSVSG